MLASKPFPWALLPLSLLTTQTTEQTPPHFSPSIDVSLVAVFDGQNFSVRIDPQAFRYRKTVRFGPSCLQINVNRPALMPTSPLVVTAEPPIIALPFTGCGCKALVLMVDLDTPFGRADHSLAPFLHWLLPDIPGDTTILTNGFADTHRAVAKSIPPQPPAGRPKHRFVILSYLQKTMCGEAFVIPDSFSGFGDRNRRYFRRDSVPEGDQSGRAAISYVVYSST